MNAEVPRSITSGSPYIGKAEGDRIGAEGGPDPARRRDHGGRRHRVDADQSGSRHHIDVMGAAATHPGVVDADEGEAVRVRPLDHGARRLVHRQHPALVASVEQHRHARLPDDAHRVPDDEHRAARRREARMVGDVEQLRQAGVLVPAQRRVDHVVGENTSLLGLVPDPAHGTLGQRTGLGGAQVDAVGGYRGDPPGRDPRLLVRQEGRAESHPVPSRLGSDPRRYRDRIFEIKSPLILQPGPAALTDGLDAILAALSHARLPR
jgi:hypothetical protein